MDKQCSKCKAVKSTDLFYKNRTKSGGINSQCKVCENIAAAKYRLTDSYKIFNRLNGIKFNKSDKGKIYYKEQARKYIINNPYKIIARSAVYSAIKKGLLINPNICSECLNECRSSAHHDDYNKPLEIRWLCRLCHNAWHRDNQAIQHIGSTNAK